MNTQAACQFPYTFNRIQIGTICRQKKQRKALRTKLAPLFMNPCMMICCVIQNHINLSFGLATGFSKLFKKIPKGFTIKPLLLSLVYKFTIANPNPP
ncbi:hypothetical protein ER57_02410 [Smithella sp. SCADC]|nr:hypothetical protein ER57_02410 [Smithella sp. SCADC]